MAYKYIHELPEAETLETWYKSVPECCRKCSTPSINYYDEPCKGVLVGLTCPLWNKCEYKKAYAKE